MCLTYYSIQLKFYFLFHFFSLPAIFFSWDTVSADLTNRICNPLQFLFAFIIIKKNMKEYNFIFINGKFLEQKLTGVQRFAFETLKEIDNLLEEKE